MHLLNGKLIWMQAVHAGSIHRLPMMHVTLTNGPARVCVRLGLLHCSDICPIYVYLLAARVGIVRPLTNLCTEIVEYKWNRTAC